jgi:REP element-mobilizing transposase RayT
MIRSALRQAVATGFRVIDWSIQGDHLHLIVEADNTVALSRGMQGLSIRIARGLNRALGRKGKVFADRYHVRVLTTPREVRNARAYVMLNARRHAAQRGRRLVHREVDIYSSWAWFDGWKDCPKSWIRKARAGPDAERCNTDPQTWLMRVGWRRHGLIRLGEVPGTQS